MSDSTNATVGTWSQVDAMSRSHKWSVFRSIPPTRTCSACGDTFESEIRYCPGGVQTRMVDASDTLFIWPEVPR